MKRPRTKKLRGGKRKLAAPEKVENSQKPAQPQSMQNATTARPIAEQTLASTSGPARPTAANSEQPERQANNVLKTKAAPHENAASNEPDTEVERWISLIREGGLDRKVKVTGKTGALLVR